MTRQLPRRVDTQEDFMVARGKRGNKSNGMLYEWDQRLEAQVKSVDITGRLCLKQMQSGWRSSLRNEDHRVYRHHGRRLVVHTARSRR